MYLRQITNAYSDTEFRYVDTPELVPVQYY